MLKRIIAILGLGACCIGINLYAQTVVDQYTTKYDLSTRLGIAIDKDIYKGLSLSWEEEARFKNLSTEFDCLYSSLSMHYRINDYFKVGAGYTFILLWHDGKKKTDYEKYLDPRHRVNIDLVANYRIRKWKFTLRERSLMTLRTDDPDLLEKSNPNFKLRSKLSVEYSIFGQPLKPYLGCEISNTLNAPTYAGGNYIDRIRTDLGVKWRLNRRNSLDFYYQLNVGLNRDIDVDYKKDDVTIKAIYRTYEQTFTNNIGVAYTFDWK